MTDDRRGRRGTQRFTRINRSRSARHGSRESQADAIVSNRRHGPRCDCTREWGPLQDQIQPTPQQQSTWLRLVRLPFLSPSVSPFKSDPTADLSFPCIGKIVLLVWGLSADGMRSARMGAIAAHSGRSDCL
eukprot:2629560-Prymnesium_polylepis.1